MARKEFKECYWKTKIPIKLILNKEDIASEI